MNKIKNDLLNISLEFTLLDNLMYRVCKKECGWSEWCPYGKNLARSKDIQCGIVSQFVKDLTTSQKVLISTLTKKEQEDYIDGLKHFVLFIDRTIERLSYLQLDGVLEFYQEYGAHTYTKGFIKTILHEIQKANLLFNKAIKSNNIVFLVEGQSEEVFIKNYYQHFDGDVSVYSYKGEGNAKGGNLHILIDFFLENNHAIFVQVDLDNDNNKKQQLEKHKAKYKDKEVYFFAFKSNLEESYSYELVTKALKYIYSNFAPKTLGAKETTYKDLLATIDIKIDDIKIDLAHIVAQLIYHKYLRDNKPEDEIYRFVEFIDNAYPISQHMSKYYNYWKDKEK